MSLNGLDDPAVIDAYQAALAEAGGWYANNSIPAFARCPR
jgi:hypothetical protein